MSKHSLISKKLCEDEEFTDFKLSTAEGSLSVHKAQLAAHSDVFKAMLSREWKETTEGHIEIQGVTLQTLQDLKDYMYLGLLPNDGLQPLLLLADCYMIDTLKAECVLKLSRMITPENLYDNLEFSILNKIPDLTFSILGAMPKSIVDDARKVMIDNQKNSSSKEKNGKESEPVKNDGNTNAE